MEHHLPVTLVSSTPSKMPHYKLPGAGKMVPLMGSTSPNEAELIGPSAYQTATAVAQVGGALICDTTNSGYRSR
jgi:hypothetical protein